ncbi:type II toxin-antitoxin system YoeB family toxin [Candidatus Pacearchaeota archaeon]|nr:type II toxin-antitoxin system YoeB family toxin [Candidatus Pacearchaeota archaeon]
MYSGRKIKIECKIQFVNEKVQKAFEKLAEGSYEEKELRKFIERAFNDICKDPFCGIQIPKKLIPQEYVKKFTIKNVWKYNLPNAYRLIYSIEKGTLYIISIVLEWLDHKEYERRFKY